MMLRGGGGGFGGSMGSLLMKHSVTRWDSTHLTGDRSRLTFAAAQADFGVGSGRVTWNLQSLPLLLFLLPLPDPLAGAGWTEPEGGFVSRRVLSGCWLHRSGAGLSVRPPTRPLSAPAPRSPQYQVARWHGKGRKRRGTVTVVNNRSSQSVSQCPTPPGAGRATPKTQTKIIPPSIPVPPASAAVASSCVRRSLLAGLSVSQPRSSLASSLPP